MTWRYDDGGRKAAGYQGTASDCVCRAVAIASGLPYQEVYDAINALALRERRGKRKRGKSSARSGVYKPTHHRLIEEVLGWRWTPTMRIGQGCRVHLRADELPAGRLIVQVSKHVCAVIDGVIHDTSDPSRGGARCVYGIWSPAEKTPMTQWTYPLPRTCDLCQQPFKEVFYDAKTRRGPWGLLCAPCFKTHGIGLGEGRGQEYDARTGVKRAG